MAHEADFPIRDAVDHFAGWAYRLGNSDDLANELDRRVGGLEPLDAAGVRWLEELSLFKLDVIGGFLEREARRREIGCGEVPAGSVAALLAEARWQLEMVRQAKDKLLEAAETQ